MKNYTKIKKVSLKNNCTRKTVRGKNKTKKSAKKEISREKNYLQVQKTNAHAENY